MLLKGTLLAFFCILSATLTHCLLLRVMTKKWRGDSPIQKLLFQCRLLLAVWIAFLLVYTVLFRLTPNEILLSLYRLQGILAALNFIHGIGVYFVIFLLYLIFYYIVDRSVSTSLMIAIEDSREKKITFEELKKIYDIEGKYRDELKGMEQGAFIIEDSGCYKNALKGRWHAAVFRTLKSYFKLGIGG